MFQEEKQTNIHVFLPQQVQFQEMIRIQSYPIDSEIKVTYKPLYFSDEYARKQPLQGDKMFFKLQLRKQCLTLTLEHSDNIYQVLKANFKCFFCLRRSKNSTNAVEPQLSFKKQEQMERKLIFSFKDKSKNSVQFSVIDASQELLNEFITKLRKLCIEDQDFHRRFRPSRKLFSTQNYSLFRANDLTKNKEVVIKAYRKDNMESQIWRECETIVRFTQVKGQGIMENIGFFQTSNSVYIIFEPFHNFLQNYSVHLNQKYKDSFSHHYEKKIINVFKIMQKVIQAMESLHNNGFSMSGIFSECNLVFKNMGDHEIPILNPYSQLLHFKDIEGHKHKLKQKVSNFQSQSSSSQILPPEHLQFQEWMFLDEEQYMEYQKRADIFGLGNILHMLQFLSQFSLFNESIFGKLNKDDIHYNNKIGKIIISNQIHEVNKHQSMIGELMNEMTFKDPQKRISLQDLKNKVNQIFQIQYLKPMTSTQSLSSHEDFLKLQNYSQKITLFNEAEKISSQSMQIKSQNLRRKELDQKYAGNHIYPSKRIKENE